VILRLTCPKCNEDSYSPSVEVFRPCPYCGLVFSGKYGTERRGKERIKDKTPFIFSYKGQNFEANVSDSSNSGLNLKILGNPSLREGDILELDIGNRHVNAQVTWVSNKSEDSPDITDSCCVGLKVLD
jgi:hypothetical protein